VGKLIGIDLGTTFSAVATVNAHGKPEILPNREGDRITPSVVLFDGDQPLVGSIAKRSAVASPENVVQFVKRQMGVPNWSFRSVDGKRYTAEDISAVLLKRFKEDAETILGDTVEGAVITVPAYFNDSQRKATLDAGRISGLNVLKIINEPTAAALAYGLEKLEQEQTILVYDLGGGTFDVTIMHIGGGEINVIATGGDKNLGGFNWDNALMEHLNEEFMRQGGCDLTDDLTLAQDLRDKAEMAKKTLSTRDKTQVFLTAKGKNLSVPVTLQTFQDITAKLVQRTGNIMEMVREDSGLPWSAIDKVLLVGGSIRMRAVPAIAEKVSGKKPSYELHPDEVVAMGAALQAELISRASGRNPLVQRDDFPLVVINDVCSHSLGVVAVDESGVPKNSIIVPRNTSIPCKQSDTYATVSDRQTEIMLQVTEGEDEELEYVTIALEAPLRIPPYPRGAPVEVTFHYDSNGVIRITILDLTAKKSLGEVQLVRKGNLTDDQVKAKQVELRKVTVN